MPQSVLDGRKTPDDRLLSLSVGPEGPATWTNRDFIGRICRDLAAASGGHVVIEIEGGRVLSHSLGDHPPPSSLVQALLHRDVAVLALTRRRADVRHDVSAMMTGALDSTSTVRVLPLPQRMGWLWVIDADEEDLNAMRRAASLVAEAIAERGHDPLRRALLGEQPLPPSVLGPGSLWLLASRCELPAVTPMPSCRTVLDGRSYLLAVDERARGQDGERFSGATGVFTNTGHRDLADVRQLLDEALDLVPTGSLSRLADQRSALVLSRLGRDIDTLPAAGPDPLADLLTNPSRRDAARTLLAWLDAHGDTVSAAARIHVHVNTFRYRMSRLRGSMDLDLDNPDVRLEAHLRLRWAAGHAYDARPPAATAAQA